MWHQSAEHCLVALQKIWSMPSQFSQLIFFLCAERLRSSWSIAASVESVNLQIQKLDPLTHATWQCSRPSINNCDLQILSWQKKIENMLIHNHQSHAKYLCSFQHFSSVQNVRQKTAATCPSFAYKTYKFILIRHLTLNFLNKFNKISKCVFWRIKFVMFRMLKHVWLCWFQKKIRGQISSLFYLVSRFSTRTKCTIKKLLLQFPLFPARLLFIRILQPSHLRDSANGALWDLVHQAQKLLSIVAFSKSTKKSQSKMVHHPPPKKNRAANMPKNGSDMIGARQLFCTPDQIRVDCFAVCFSTRLGIFHGEILRSACEHFVPFHANDNFARGRILQSDPTVLCQKRSGCVMFCIKLQ